MPLLILVQQAAPGTQTVYPVSVGTGENLGTPTTKGGQVAVYVGGIDSLTRVGTPSITGGVPPPPIVLSVPIADTRPPQEATILLHRAGQSTLDLTGYIDSARWTTAAVGGFGSCSLSIPGLRTDLGYLGTVRVTIGPRVLWEGRLEDIRYSYGADQSTEVQAFGLQRLLSDTTVRRIWSKRDLSFQDVAGPVGGNIGGGITKAEMQVDIGQFDQSDLTRSGFQISANTTQTVPSGWGRAVDITLGASGLTIPLLRGNITRNAITGLVWSVIGSDDGTTWTAAHGGGQSTQIFSGTNQGWTFTAGVRVVRVWLFNTSLATITPTGTDYLQLEQLRVIGVSNGEDFGTATTGGFYGGTVLRDLISLVPGLTLGTVDDGTDFLIQSVERAVRDQALSVVKEVAGYYEREWGVWESDTVGTGRFDWTSRNLDEPQWVVTIADCDQLELETSTDGISSTSYVLYTDAPTGLDAEQSAVTTAERNPWVKQGRTSDGLSTPGFPMTSTSAAQLAAKLAAVDNNYPQASGRIVLPARKMIPNAVGSPQPAYAIRAGDNILISDLPKSDPFTTGRDGQTLFHIVSTDANLPKGRVTLELEGQTRRSDVLLARLAAATRTLTG